MLDTKPRVFGGGQEGKGDIPNVDFLIGEGQHSGGHALHNGLDAVHRVREAAVCTGDEGVVTFLVLIVAGVQCVKENAVLPVDGKEGGLRQIHHFLRAVFLIGDADAPGGAVGLLINLKLPKPQRLVHPDLPGLGPAPVSAGYGQHACVVQLPRLILNVEGFAEDCRAVLKRQRLSRHHGLIGYFRGHQNQCAEQKNQKNGQVRKKRAVEPNEGFAV